MHSDNQLCACKIITGLAAPPLRTMDTLRQHMTSNQSQVKGTDAGVYAWASSGGSVNDNGRQLNNSQFGGSAVASGLTDARHYSNKASLNNRIGISKEQVETCITLITLQAQP